MNTEWVQSGTDMYAITENGIRKGVVLTRLPVDAEHADHKWKVITVVPGWNITYVPDHIQQAPIETIQAWALAYWRTQ